VSGDPELNPYEQRPWVGLYDPFLQPIAVDSEGSVLKVFQDLAAIFPDRIAVKYFDGELSYRTLGATSDSYAVWLSEAGVRRSDRLFIALQNVPQLLIAVLGAWKVGAVPVLGNPMYREPELVRLFLDCSPKAALCHEEHYATVRAAAGAIPITTTSPLAFQTRFDARVLPARMATGAPDFLTVIDENDGRRPAELVLKGDEMGLLLYTSGTTGTPKGAMLTHRNLLYTARLSRSWFAMTEQSSILAIAPLFHITGFELHFCLSLVCGSPLILFYRFEAQVSLDAMREHRPTFTIGAATAFTALMNTPGAVPEDFRSFRAMFTGGAPVSPTLAQSFEARFSQRLRTAYGMTETTAPTHISPLVGKVPADANSGAMAIGVPVPNVEAKVVDSAGRPCPIGEAGEICVRGPQVMAGYWNRPEETAEVLSVGWLRTGDIGFMDASGWFYLIDRKKDMIIASGFKVWPREVEDTLYAHEAIREVAVVGVNDSYRGETVKAFASLRPGRYASPAELIEYCRQRLAAYKCPRTIDILDELPKTASGKIMRHVLRAAAAAALSKTQ
jgi:long-chain acyl-CoA synthetase